MSDTAAPLAEADAHQAYQAYRAELVGYCYRFFGSYAEAEDAVQETMLRAWQRAGGFEGRSSLRTWLYRIATNICLDMRRAPQRRSLPMDLSGAGQVPADPGTLTTRPEATWVGPVPDDRVVTAVDPAEVAAQRESIRLAFIVALQLLAPRQRAVLILRDVLDWSAQECADLLGDSVASVNSALARARRCLAERDVAPTAALDDARAASLLADYVAAFEAYDVDRLVRLLADDATFSMPPYELWLQRADAIERWWRGPGQLCRNSRVVATRANGAPAAAVYHDVGGGRWEPFALHVIDSAGGRISALTHFMGAEVFARFGLPDAIVEPATR